MGMGGGSEGLIASRRCMDMEVIMDRVLRMDSHLLRIIINNSTINLIINIILIIRPRLVPYLSPD